MWPAIVALVAIVLAAAYLLRLFQDIMNGPELDDLPVRARSDVVEGLAVAPLLAALVYVGVQPARDHGGAFSGRCRQMIALPFHAGRLERARADCAASR